MSFSRHASKYLLGGVTIIGIGTYMGTRSPKPGGTPESNTFQTPGVKNIEGAYQKGGATSTHTKGYGGTTLGQKSDITKDNLGTGQKKGMEEEHLGDEQRQGGTEKGVVGKEFEKMKYGSKTGK